MILFYFQLGAFLRHPMRGVILQTFGAGNVPSDQLLFKELKDACDRGVVIVNCTQCASGNVTNEYPAALVSLRDKGRGKERKEGSANKPDLTSVFTKLAFCLHRSCVSWVWCRELT